MNENAMNRLAEVFVGSERVFFISNRAACYGFTARLNNSLSATKGVVYIPNYDSILTQTQQEVNPLI